MHKGQYRVVDRTKEISCVQFGLNSSQQIQQESHLRITSKNLYTNQLQPFPYGVLDRRMGISVKELTCDTCKQGLNECVGHFGYLELALPVFHVGHFRATLSILQIICKTCSHVMLKSLEKQNFLKRLINPNLSYLARKTIRHQIIIKAKKFSTCPNCNAMNGTVKKGPGLMKIIHEFRTKGDFGARFEKAVDAYLTASKVDSELNNLIGRNVVQGELNPITVLELFQNIPNADIPLLGMKVVNASPEDLIVTRVYVPPVSIRPSVMSDKKTGTTEDDLTMKQSEILMINDVIKRHFNSGGKAELITEDWDFLQLHVALYFDSEISGVPYSMLPKKSTHGIVQRLKGKHGRFRGNLSGKRVDFSGRTVISPDPNLMIHQVGVPESVARILTYPEKVNKTNLKLMKELVRNGVNKYPGANYVQQRGSNFKRFLAYGNRDKVARDLNSGDIVERHMINGDILLFNRQPSLHKLSIMCHQAKIHKQRTFRFNECVCTPYNADFDGDEMNLHLPQTEEARAEAYILMSNKSNLVTPKNGEMLIAATQDFITGVYLLTQKDEFLTKEQAMQLSASMLAGLDSGMTIDLPTPAILKPRRLWTGKQIFSLILRPNLHDKLFLNLSMNRRPSTSKYDMCAKDSRVDIVNSRLLCGSMDKKTVGSGNKSSIFYSILRNFGEFPATKVMLRLAKITSYFMTTKGFSFGLNDVTPSSALLKQKQKLLERGYHKCDIYIRDMKTGTLQCQPGCSPEQTLEAVVLRELSSIREFAAKSCFQELHPTNAGLIMAECGSKGSNINISQMIACVGQQAINGKRTPNGFEKRALPHFEKFSRIPAARGFVQNSFYSGLTPTEFYFHTMAGREGLVDTAVKTAETGYLQRRLVKCLEDLVVHYDETVRNATSEIVELTYGGDGLDPCRMELTGKPVDLEHQLTHLGALNFSKHDRYLLASEVKPLAEAILAEEEFKNMRDDSRNDSLNFLLKVANRLHETQTAYRNHDKLVNEIDRISDTQLRMFLQTVRDRYSMAVTEPGTPVGALAAQSIGEPGTQMTLKTFHFAGVASMNITQGVPRIVEIINATKRMATPVITAEIENNVCMEYARNVKARIEKTTLGDVSSFIKQVYNRNSCYIFIKLDVARIRLLGLNINSETIRHAILTSKMRVKPCDVEIQSKSCLTVSPDSTKSTGSLNAEIQKMALVLKDVVVLGLPVVSRAVIAISNSVEPEQYKLCIEGYGLRDIIATPGVVGTRTRSNNILEMCYTLGIEASRSTILSEVGEVMSGHGITVDTRHIMLLASQMTARGEVLGITRHGLAKMRESVFNLASFEKTADHLFDAAFYGQIDSLSGVSERIILGMPAFIGSGLFKLLHQHPEFAIAKPSTHLFSVC